MKSIAKERQSIIGKEGKLHKEVSKEAFRDIILLDTVVLDTYH